MLVTDILGEDIAEEVLRATPLPWMQYSEHPIASAPPRGAREENYLFVHDSDARIAGLYSLVATCEARGVKPFEYRACVLARVQNHPIRAIDELLPGAWAAARGEAWVTPGSRRPRRSRLQL